MSTTIHGAQTLRQWYEAVQQFTDGTGPILVITFVAARILNFPVIVYVVNYDLPDTVDFDIHRIGRTGTKVEEKKGERTGRIPLGRAGHLGRSISFSDPDENLIEALHRN